MRLPSQCRPLWIVAFWVLLTGFAVDATAASKEEIAEAATWFDSLDWPHLHGKPYVEIVLGRVTRQGMPLEAGANPATLVDGPTVRGFLFAEDEKSFTILADGVAVHGNGRQYDEWREYPAWPFTVQRILKGWAGAPPESEVIARKIDLSVAVADALAAARRPAVKESSRHHGQPKTSRATALFALARWCGKAGRADLAVRLDEQLLTLPDEPLSVATAVVSKSRPHARGVPLRARLESEIAHALMWKATVDCGEIGVVPPGTEPVARTGLQAEFARIARDFPASADAAHAAMLAATLRNMLAEDEAHQSVDYDLLMKMSRAEQAQEGIFELRDQQYFYDYLFDPKPPTAVEELERLGLAAVPALLEILGDSRLTRSVTHGWHDEFPGPMLTYGDCAADALSKIAGRDFRKYRGAERRRLAEAWWRLVQKKGKRETRMQVVRAGGGDAYEKADELREMDPAATIEAIRAGLGATTFETARSHLLMVLARIDSEASTAVFQREMLHSPYPTCRVGAASVLLERGAQGVVPAMLAEFRRWEPSPKDGDVEMAFYPESLIRLLGGCGDANAMQELTRRRPHLPPHLRAEVAKWVVPLQPRPLPAAVEGLGERLAISALDDQEPEDGAAHPGEMTTRVCDVAAEALSRRWPDRYHFERWHL